MERTTPVSQSLNRRSLLGGLSLLGVGLLATACGGAAPSPTAAPAKTESQPAEAVKPTEAPKPAAEVKPTVAPTAAAAATAVPTTVAAAKPTEAAKPAGGTLKFGLIPDENAEKVLTRFKVFVQFLEKHLDMKVEATVGTDYSATIEAMKARKIDIAFFGPFSYVLASQVAEARVLAVPSLADGQPSTYNSIIITKKTSGITKLDELKGKSFAFADPASTSGHLIPRSLLVKAGFDVDKDLKPIFAGGHDATVLTVANGKVDAGATFEGQVNNMDKAGLIKKDELLILQKSDPIPDGPVAVRKDYDPAMTERVTKAFEAIPAETIKEAYGSSTVTKFIRASDDKLYDPLREVAKLLKLDLTKLK